MECLKCGREKDNRAIDLKWVVKRNICFNCYMRLRRNGGLHHFPPKLKECSVQGCLNLSKAKGYCSNHYHAIVIRKSKIKNTYNSICPCGTPFTSLTQQVYCSKDCSYLKRHNYEKHKEELRRVLVLYDKNLGGLDLPYRIVNLHIELIGEKNLHIPVKEFFYHSIKELRKIFDLLVD